MARPYSKKTVDQAEEICLCAANNDFDTSVLALGLDAFAAELDIPQHATALRLAFAAYREVPKVGSFQMIALEAAALIRSGWMIGDPIELLKLPVETESSTVPTVTLDKPIDMQEMADDYAKVRATPKLDETKKWLDQGPAQPPVVDQVALADEMGYPADPPAYNGDYGADS